MLLPDLEFESRRGCPLSPLAQDELTLAHLGGNTFQRTAGQSHNIARTAAREDLDAEEAEEESQDDEAAAQAIGRARERAEGSLVREAMVQARFLSINSEAISVITTPQHYFYFKF